MVCPWSSGDGTCLLTGPSTSPENSLPSIDNRKTNPSIPAGDGPGAKVRGLLASHLGVAFGEHKHQNREFGRHVRDGVGERGRMKGDPVPVERRDRVSVDLGRVAMEHGKVSRFGVESREHTREGKEEELTMIDLEGGDQHDRDSHQEGSTRKLEGQKSSPPKVVFPFVAMSPTIGERVGGASTYGSPHT